MNINCVLNCKHQQEGKCALHQLPGWTNRAYLIDPSWDCAYYEGKG